MFHNGINLYFSLDKNCLVFVDVELDDEDDEDEEYSGGSDSDDSIEVL